MEKELGSKSSEESLKRKLPMAVQKLVEERRQKNELLLSSLGATVGKKRDDAVSARLSSGIERIWKEDEEYYLGIDDLNRENHAYTKPMGLTGGLTSTNNKVEDKKGECTAFFNIIRQFVDSASARMGDILLPANDWNFDIKETPIADLAGIKDSTQIVEQDGVPLENKQGQPYTLGEFAVEEQKEAEEKVEKAKTRIQDWLTECDYKGESGKVIEDSSKLGTGVLGGAFPVKKKSKVVINGEFIVEEKIQPASRRVDVRNVFPDPNCGENIHNGSFFFERDYFSAWQLKDLIGVPGYKAAQIETVLKEGPSKIHKDDTTEQTKDDDRFEVWYYYGEITREELCACKQESADTESTEDASLDTIPVVVVMVNDTVIKAFKNPLETGEFPYDFMAWQRIQDSPFGIGIARQGRVAQDMFNASARTLMKNTNLSSAPQIIYLNGVIEPVDGTNDLYGGKEWIADTDDEIADIKNAFMTIDIPSKQNELMNLLQLAQKMMEDATGVSFLLQGQQGSAPDTVGGMELLHKNASALLRRIARIYDNSITEPHIRRYYDWLLIHGDDSEKGDMDITAVGSSALVEREIQAMQTLAILNMSLNPAFGLSPEKSANELLMAQRFTPSKFQLSEQEKQAAQEAQQNPVPAPQIEVATINAKSRETVADMQMQSSERMKVEDLDRDTEFQLALAERNEQDHQARIAELELKRELEMMKYANANQIQLTDVKAQLAETAMKLRATKELVSMKAPADKLPKPAVEPVGKAKPGESYQS